MSLKDILAIVLDAEGDAAALRAASLLALQHQAHAGCVFLLALPDEPLAYEPTVVAGVWAELLNRARQEAAGELGKVETALKAMPQPIELRRAEALGRDLGRVGAVHARYGDLAVLTRPSAADRRELRHDLIEGVLFHAGRPALIVPPDWAGDSLGKRVVVAWDASREATRALGDAAALIGAAESVTVVTVDAKPKAFGHGDQPGANIAAHLSRRGAKVDVRNIAAGGRPLAEALMVQAIAVNADLVVMGGYGHARLQEFLFGGATREALDNSPLPILMSR
jgi:nucleotide-binding universal stress UspA family protein